jgi:hypothetical protein
MKTMKKIHLIYAILLPVLVFSCYEDKGNYDYKELDPVMIEGLDEVYSVYTYQDVLDIRPTVSNDERYDYCWQLYPTTFNVNLRQVPRPDTLALTRELNYEVLLNPGEYILVFNARDKTTGYTEMKTVTLKVSTRNMTGWYLLKDHDGKTDFDFIYPDGRFDNWIARLNQGKQLEGNAVKALFVREFKETITSENLNTFVVLAERDAAIIRIDHGTIVRDYDQMFFAPPADRNLQNAVLDVAENNVYVINDGKVYFMTKAAGLFQDPVDPSTGNYHMAPFGALGMSPLFFYDVNSTTIVTYNGSAYTPSSNDIVRNMNADLLWMEGYNNTKWYTYALFKHRESGEMQFVKFKNNDYYGNISTISSMPVPPASNLIDADKVTGNYDYEILYYAKGNKIYRSNVDVPPMLESDKVITLPEGEVVTCMQHMKKPIPQSSTVISVDKLAVASHANGRYKVWLFDLQSGDIVPLSQPTFEGEGRVTCINYVQPEGGIRIF